MNVSAQGSANATQPQSDFVQERREASKDTTKQVWTTIVLGALLVIAVPSMLVWSSGTSLDQAARTGLILSALGMVIGIQTIVFGVWLLLLDVRSLSDVGADLGTGQPAKASAFTEHPGTIIVLAGVLLVIASLYRDWVIVEHGANPPSPSPSNGVPVDTDAHGTESINLPNGKKVILPPFEQGRQTSTCSGNPATPTGTIPAPEGSVPD